VVQSVTAFGATVAARDEAVVVQVLLVGKALGAVGTETMVTDPAVVGSVPH